jgi:hypothetical protein
VLITLMSSHKISNNVGMFFVLLKTEKLSLNNKIIRALLLHNIATFQFIIVCIENVVLFWL